VNIGDNYPQSLLINALSKAIQSQPQTGTQTSDVGKLFSAVLNQMLMQMDGTQTLDNMGGDSVMPDLYSQLNPSIQTAGDDYVPANTTNKSLRFQEMNPDQLDKELGGKLKGLGEVFVRAGKSFNIDPALLAAIAKHETGNGKSRAAIEKNNIAGMMGVGGLKSYASVEDSINDMARNLSKNYLGRGLADIAKIGAKYAPINAANDPTGLNNYWVKGVSKYFNQLRV
jgi:beta-N-acetylglucosaminidase